MHSHFKLFNESIEKVFLNPLILKLLKRVQFLKSVCVIFQQWILSYVFQRLFYHLFKANFVCLSEQKRFWLRWMWSLFVCLFLPSYLSLKMSVCLFICLCTLFDCFFLYFLLSLFICVYLSIFLSVYLSFS